MTGLTRRPLAVFVCCLFAAVPVLHAASETDVLILAATSERQKPGAVPTTAPPEADPAADATPEDTVMPPETKKRTPRNRKHGRSR